MINNTIVLIPVQSTQSRSASTTFLTTHLARVLITKTCQPPVRVGGRPSQLGSRTPTAPGGCAAPTCQEGCSSSELGLLTPNWGLTRRLPL